MWRHCELIYKPHNVRRVGGLRDKSVPGDRQETACRLRLEIRLLSQLFKESFI